jgi:hypothetical protein
MGLCGNLSLSISCPLKFTDKDKRIQNEELTFNDIELMLLADCPETFMDKWAMYIYSSIIALTFALLFIGCALYRKKVYKEHKQYVRLNSEKFGINEDEFDDREHFEQLM